MTARSSRPKPAFFFL